MKCEIVTGLNSEVAIIIVFTAILAVLELCKIVITPKLYVQSLMNLGTWILIGLVIITTIPNLAKQKEIGAYQYQAAAVSFYIHSYVLIHFIKNYNIFEMADWFNNLLIFRYIIFFYKVYRVSRMGIHSSTNWKIPSLRKVH